MKPAAKLPCLSIFSCRAAWLAVLAATLLVGCKKEDAGQPGTEAIPPAVEGVPPAGQDAPATSDASPADRQGSTTAAPKPLALAPITEEGRGGQRPAAGPGGQGAAAGEQGGSISPEAQQLLDQVRDVYAGLEAFQVEGQVTVNVVAGPEKQNEQQQLSGAFQAPNKFRHDAENEVLLVSDGEKLHVLDRSRNVFQSSDLPSQERSAEALPQQMVQMLQMQNPAIFYALSQAPFDDLQESGAQVSKADDQTIDGTKYAVVAIDLPQRQIRTELLIDPKSHLVRRIATDMAGAMKAQGMDMETATLTIDYTTINTAPPPAADLFAFTPPEGARDIEAMRQEMARQQQAEEAALRQMVGQPAPDFTLNGLDGQAVTLSGLKDQVVVLDFWATWCGPCVASLPHLAEIRKERAGQPVTVLAVNLREAPEEVQNFLKEKELDLAVVLDQDGGVADQYNVQAIPMTVIVGKDGLVRQYFVGMTPDEQINAAIDAGLEGKPIEVPAVEPATEESSTEEPATEEPAMEEPAAEEPAAEEPAAEEPAAEEPAAEEPAAEEPATEEPVMEEPAPAEPAADQPAADQPAADQPAAEQPAAEGSAAEEPAAMEPSAEEPAAAAIEEVKPQE